MHFLITAFVNDNSSEITTLVITDLWKGYNVCTKILTTFTLNNKISEINTDSQIQSRCKLMQLHGPARRLNWAQYLPEKRAFYTILTILRSHACLGIFSS